MIYIDRLHSKLYKDYLENIDKYDLTYIISTDHDTGEEYILDNNDIFYFNPNKLTSEVALDLLRSSTKDSHYSIALLHCENLTIKKLKEIASIKNLSIDYYAIFSDKYNNIYHTSNFLYKQKLKKEE